MIIKKTGQPERLSGLLLQCIRFFMRKSLTPVFSNAILKYDKFIKNNEIWGGDHIDTKY